MKDYTPDMIAMDLLKDWHLNAEASENSILGAMKSLGCSLPSDYVDFLRKNSGASPECQAK